VFLDELDGLASARSEVNRHGGGPSVSDRVVSQLLIEMDGVKVCNFLSPKAQPHGRDFCPI
jgi:SpoVK/Ycf46/Vps4 family AAA+-type ATPase